MAKIYNLNVGDSLIHLTNIDGDPTMSPVLVLNKTDKVHDHKAYILEKENY